jgi:hypothetical protein
VQHRSLPADTRFLISTPALASCLNRCAIHQTSFCVGVCQPLKRATHLTLLLPASLMGLDHTRAPPTASGPTARAAVTPFKPQVTSPWSRYAQRTAPTRKPIKGPHLTTWSHPHGSGQPTLGTAPTRTSMVTSPQPGPPQRHLPDSDAPDLHGSPTACRSTRLRPHGARSPLTPRPRAQRRRAPSIRDYAR